MKATFRNKFRVVHDIEGDDVILYNHPFRLNLEILIEHKDPRPDEEQNHVRHMDWGITLKTRNKTVVKMIRGELAEDILGYIFKRTREDIRSLSYEDIMELAKTWSIQ